MVPRLEPLMRVMTLMLSLVLAALPQTGYGAPGCGVLGAGDDRWPVAAPEDVGLNSATLCSVVTRL